MPNKLPGCHLANAWRSRSKHILQWRYRNEVSVHSSFIPPFPFFASNCIWTRLTTMKSFTDVAHCWNNKLAWNYSSSVYSSSILVYTSDTPCIVQKSIIEFLSEMNVEKPCTTLHGLLPFLIFKYHRCPIRPQLHHLTPSDGANVSLSFVSTNTDLMSSQTFPKYPTAATEDVVCFGGTFPSPTAVDLSVITDTIQSRLSLSPSPIFATAGIMSGKWIIPICIHFNFILEHVAL